MTAPDPVQRLREVLEIREVTRSRDLEPTDARIDSAAKDLLAALPTMLQAAKADGYDYGVETCSAAFAAAAVLDVANPFRVAASDELARETREQGHE